MIPSYDDLLILQDSLEQARRLSGYDMPWARVEDFASITVILGSSRSGSSLLFHALASTGAVWAPAGEETPILRASGLGWVDSLKESDVVSSILPEEAKTQIRQALFCELGGAEAVSEARSPAYVDQVARRMLWQWPEEEFRVTDLVQLAQREPDWATLARRLGLEENFYDWPLSSNRRSPLALPPWFIEEPPYVALAPRERPTPALLRERPILLKTSAHAYRIPLLKTLFPAAQFRWIVLARNPAASVNGLMDGWLCNAFHSHNLRGVKELNIRGYTAVVPHGDHWWKFDLPPGWSEWTESPLAEVCAFQWRSAYAHILSQIHTLRDPVLMVKHEDLVDPLRGKAEMRKVLDFLGVAPAYAPNLLTTRPIMTSVDPAPARWRRRENQILPLLQSAETRSVAERLGYDLTSPLTLL